MVVLDTQVLHTNEKPSLLPEHLLASKSASAAAPLESQIALIAYFKAQSRGFLPGYELHDWFEAEQELKLV